MEDLAHLSLSSNHKDENVLTDFIGNEDAGVYRLNEDLAIIQTADFITPVVDDPYLYGQIAAANALSDVYAMGGEVKTALNLVMWDSCNISPTLLKEILQGGLSKIQESGGVLLGGHTIADSEQKYGLSVTGVIHPQKIWRNNQAKEGDCFVLTKPIGMGILTTALKAGKLSLTMQNTIAKIMATLNQKAAKIAQKYPIHACTDITGFGLLGHLYEMCNPNITLCLYSKEVPILKEAIEFAKLGIIPGGSHTNEKGIKSHCHFQLDKDSPYKGLEILLFDAQTSGGLVFALPQKEAFLLKKELIDNGLEDTKIIAEAKIRSDFALEIF
ncbi:selenide, water dikinase SelD [Helicobacter mesocricetorum]|uniref:selenide, water dikinase SelD n=1 Tax=Helicobacter mesocricetorum TaxID=87012 RepID=UPI001F23C9AD|nr:selenide, water dikinase SelD [Helicobacter mesocricetorum]